MDVDLLASRLVLDRSDHRALQRQLYDRLRQLILSGRMPTGTRLPASRTMARALAVSRNTVVAAFDQLAAEGFVETNKGGGTRVAALSAGLFGTTAQHTGDDPQPASMTLSTRGQLLTEIQRDQRLGPTARHAMFVHGVPDLAAFPRALWARLLGRAARLAPPEGLDYGNVQGLPILREALTRYLREARAVVCRPDQIFVVSGAQSGIDLVARLLLDRGNHVWLEDPCYRGALAAFLGAGAAIVPLPVDQDGISIQQNAPVPRMIYVTPSHQYPLGMLTSLDRRLQLLQVAARHRALILEDDYDSEFRYVGQPIASLQGLSGGARVIYLGSFSKTLIPGIRVGYMVVPEGLIDPMRNALRNIGALPATMIQAALAQFIDDGHLRAHIRRMRAIYEERRARLIQILQDRLQGVGTLEQAPAGLQLALSLPRAISDRNVEDASARQGIETLALSRLAIQRKDINGLLLGYGNAPLAHIEPAASTLAGIIRSAARKD